MWLRFAFTTHIKDSFMLWLPVEMEWKFSHWNNCGDGLTYVALFDHLIFDENELWDELNTIFDIAAMHVINKINSEPSSSNDKCFGETLLTVFVHAKLIFIVNSPEITPWSIRIGSPFEFQTESSRMESITIQFAIVYQLK